VTDEGRGWGLRTTAAVAGIFLEHLLPIRLPVLQILFGPCPIPEGLPDKAVNQEDKEDDC